VQTDELKKMLKDDQFYVIPGVFDCLGALIAQKTGFKAVSITGNGLAGSFLGLPDSAMLSAREVVDFSRNIAGAVNIPVIGDADTGYGDPITVMRTVKEFEAAGIAAVHIEDQEKRGSYYTGTKRLVPTAQHSDKIKAAVYAKRDPDFCVIARTDALRTDGMDEALRRIKAYQEAGADAVFLVGISSLADIRQISQTVSVPLIINANAGDPIAQISPAEIHAAGAKFIFYPSLLRAAVVKCMSDMLDSLYQSGSAGIDSARVTSSAEINELLSLPGYQDLERRFKSD